ncbi:MAG TPA: hypothetical protein VFR58_13750 [Flavisolibacter sp.]|nr:hypothetical protein [Flavisolibacter sp.]
MKPYFDLAIVIPVGPGTDPDFIIDTIRSFIHYTASSYKIILADDSQQGIGEEVKKSYPDIDVIRTNKSMGAMAGLYITLSMAFRHALEKYSFRLLLKLDTDALVIGSEPEREALELFEKRPEIAIAGQYPLDYEGKPWDVGWPRARIVNGTMTWKFIRRPVANVLLRKLYISALKHGYRTGESVFGGAYFMGHSFLKALYEHKYLPNQLLGKLNMGEDHLFALLAKALGFELGDLSTNGLPFGCAWKGLPASPEQLHRAGKKIIHSTRYWQEMKEADIRRYFSQQRQPAAQNIPAPVNA